MSWRCLWSRNVSLAIDQRSHSVTLDEVLSQHMRKLCKYRIAYRYHTRSGTLQLVRSAQSAPHYNPSSSVIMATQDKHQQAVKENRMVSVQEATIRKAVGYTLFGLTTLRLYTRVYSQPDLGHYSLRKRQRRFALDCCMHAYRASQECLGLHYPFCMLWRPLSSSPVSIISADVL